MALEPFGDNNCYWIIPREEKMSFKDISELEQTFKSYKPTLIQYIKDFWCGDKSRLIIILSIILILVITIDDFIN